MNALNPLNLDKYLERVGNDMIEMSQSDREKLMKLKIKWSFEDWGIQCEDSKWAKEIVQINSCS